MEEGVVIFHIMDHNIQVDKVEKLTNNNLLQSIRKLTSTLLNVKELDEQSAIKLTENVGELFVGNINSTWWWESLAKKYHTIVYGDADGLKVLEKLLLNNQQVFLFVTDDEPKPWCVFEGDIKDILYILSEERFFEYFLVSINLDWVIFDTHHNSLVVTGILVEKSKTI